MLHDKEQRREAQPLKLVFRKLKLADRLEILQRDAAFGLTGAACHDGDVVSRRDARRGHLSNRRRHAVDVIEGVGEPRSLLVSQGSWQQFPRHASHLPQPLAAGLAKGVNIWAEHCGDRNQRADRLNALDEPGLRELRDELGDEAIAELAGNQIGHQERATFGLGHAERLAGQCGFHFGPGKVCRELLPERGVARHRHLENLSRGDALSEKAKLFRKAEFSGIASLHESREGLLDQPRAGIVRSHGKLRL